MVMRQEAESATDYLLTAGEQHAVRTASFWPAGRTMPLCEAVLHVMRVLCSKGTSWTLTSQVPWRCWGWQWNETPVSEVDAHPLTTHCLLPRVGEWELTVHLTGKSTHTKEATSSRHSPALSHFRLEPARFPPAETNQGPQPWPPQYVGSLCLPDTCFHVFWMMGGTDLYISDRQTATFFYQCIWWQFTIKQ